MEIHRELFQIAKLLLSEDDSQKTAMLLLDRVLAATGADRGFIVVREGGSYTQKYDVHFDRSRVSSEERKFSRSLVRQVIQTQEAIYSPSLPADPRFSSLDSVRWLGDCAVLVVPLRHADEVWGVLYLERRGSVEGFSGDAIELMDEFAELAALSLRRALEQESQRERSRSLERDLFSKFNFTGIVTQSPKMLELLKVVAQIADSDVAVLLLGESGTGKDLLAQALHWNSSRKARPFVTLHCAALPQTVLESELFGHVKGAFTGADRERAGRLASADRGTLFLDEIAEMPGEVQAKLLRFLQFGEIQRVGSDRVETLDVRVIAATHADLAALVKSGSFRQDLYFRLRVMELRLPPLRERRGDLPLLIESFLRKHWKRPDEKPRWTLRAQRALESHSYPGNVRELEHVIQRACLLATTAEMDADLFPPEMRPAIEPAPTDTMELTNSALKAAREAANDQVERQFLAALMERHAGNVSKAAREAGMQRGYLQKLLAKHRSALLSGS